MRVIREMQKGEELLLRQIFFRAVHQSAAGEYSATQRHAWAPEQFDAARWIGRMTKLRPFVVVDHGTLAGFSDLQDSGYIDMFFVDPAFGRSGVGHLLMQEIYRQAGARAMPRLYSHVSLTAQPFFARHGFQVTERRTVQIGEVTLENALMDKLLFA